MAQLQRDLESPALRRFLILLLWLLAAMAWFDPIDKTAAQVGDLQAIWSGVHNFDSGRPIYFGSGVGSFLWPPSALLLMSPLGKIPLPMLTFPFAVLDAVAIASSCVLALRLAERNSPLLAPVAVLAASLLLPARREMWLLNINGFLLLLEVLMLLAAVRGRWTLAGLALGISLALKPVLFPLLLVFVLARRWRAAATAIAIPVVLNVVALPFTTDSARFITHVIPFLLQGQAPQFQDGNMALGGAAAVALHVPRLIIEGGRVLVGILSSALAIWVWRSKTIEPRVKIPTVAGIIMIAVVLCSSYAWPAYLLYIVPLLALFGARGSVVKGIIALLAIYMIMGPDYQLWASVFAFPVSQARVTSGLLLLLAAITWVVVTNRRSGSGVILEAAREPAYQS